MVLRVLKFIEIVNEEEDVFKIVFAELLSKRPTWLEKILISFKI